MRVYMTCRYTGRDWYEQSKCLSATSAPHSRHRNMLSLCICIKTHLHRAKRRWTCNMCVCTAYMLVYIPLCACSCLHIPACTYQTQHLRRICMPRIYKHILHVYHHVFTYAHALTLSVSAASAPNDSSFATVPASPFSLA